MLAPCPHCGYALWAEVRRIGAFRCVVYFDDEERSATCAEHVRSCPACGVNLLAHAIAPQELTPQ